MQRELSKLAFHYKRLSEFNTNETAVRELYEGLIKLTKKPKPTVLRRFATGKDVLSKRFGETGKYKIKFGEYDANGATIPYLIEAFLLRDIDAEFDNTILTAVNKSVSYQDCPFIFSKARNIEFCKKGIFTKSLEVLLTNRGLTHAQGITLFLHFVSPYIEFTDKAKANIIADGFIEDLTKVIEYLTRDVFKEVDRMLRDKKSFDAGRIFNKAKKDNKKELMIKYFMKSFEIASGGYSVLSRQIFYTERNIIKLKHDVDIMPNDYNVFTQQIVTDFIEKYPELEKMILFSRRGYFSNPFTDEEIPLGTQDVIRYIDRTSENRIYQRTDTIYDIPEELQYNHVLFVEKEGFNILLKKSGLRNELNLGIMSTQGFGTRALKKLFQYLNQKEITVYVLHDCDIAGYLIWDKLLNGSKTFKKGLKVTRIGLTLEDVKELKKLDYAEEAKYDKNYKDSLSILTDKEREFFVTGESGIFRRVELNALTSPELIKFIKEKITSKPIRPSLEQLQSYISIDKDEIIKDALFKAHKTDMEVEINKEEIARNISLAVNKDPRHWTDTFTEFISEWKDKKSDEIAELLMSGDKGL